MNFTALKFEPHTILRAYSVLFGEVPSGAMLFLDKKGLRKQWESRARNIGQGGTKSGWQQPNQREHTLDYEELDWAYRSLLELLGDRDQAIVSAWACESIDAVNAVLLKGRNGVTPMTTSRTKSARRSAQKTMHPAAMRRTSAVRTASPVAPSTETVEPMPVRRLPQSAPGPRARLMFGRFLLSRGHITLQQLIDAVRWQRAQRPPVGRIAMNWGILSSNQVYEILTNKEPEDRFCDVAVRKGYMTGYQRLAVLGRQREMQKPIGSYFVEQGILTRDEIEGLAVEAKSQ